MLGYSAIVRGPLRPTLEEAAADAKRLCGAAS